jgi:Protein of unknown function (DUF1153)
MLYQLVRESLMHRSLNCVIGPDGSALTRANLPPSDTRRWVIRRKATVIAAVRGGLLSLDEAYKRYMLTPEEYRDCERLIRSFYLQ